MVKRKGVELRNLSIIEESEVPATYRRYTPYREILKRIGKGKALVLSEDEVSLDTAAAALRRLQRRGEFKNFRATRRTIDGKKHLYIINPSGEN